MDGKFYASIIENHLGEINKMLGKKWRLKQDNDPKHTSKVAKEFLANVPKVMDWPSCSPDLNSIVSKSYGLLLRATLKTIAQKFE